MSDDEEVVYVRTKTSGHSGTVLHTEPDCSRLSSAKNVHESPRKSYPEDTQVCSYCRDEVPKAQGGRNGPWETLKEMSAEDLVTDGGEVKDEQLDDPLEP